MSSCFSTRIFLSIFCFVSNFSSTRIASEVISMFCYLIETVVHINSNAAASSSYSSVYKFCKKKGETYV